MKLIATTTILVGTLCAASNPKRGLVYIPNSNWPQDNALWTAKHSALSWYYTYNERPNPDYASHLEFVPMMWGMGNNPDDTSFRDTITGQLKNGANIRYALSFNEADMRSDYGGSDIMPERAARGYIANFIPLRKLGVKIGMPAMSGSGSGIQWLRDFESNCTAKMAAASLGSKCEYDFIPVHWYDNFGGLQSHINEVVSVFPNTKVWVTEYAYAHQSLQATQDFYRESIEYLDGSIIIERYSYFGAFRSSVSNVGPNATFLDNTGQLTDIGRWYLGSVGGASRRPTR